MNSRPTTYVAVDLDAVAHNARQVLGGLKPGARLCAVVKANAYGHGMVPVARTCLAAGAQWLGVSTVDEGVTLREADIRAPVLVFMPASGDEVRAAVEHSLTCTVVSSAQVMALQREAERQGAVARAHVYQDLGLGRMGGDEPLVDVVSAAEPWPQIEIGGTYAHFGPPGSAVALPAMEWAGAGSSLKAYAAVMFDALKEATERRLMFHAAASGLYCEATDNHLDMVRIGTLLYGQYPDHIPQQQRTLDLRPTFELRSHIVAVHTLQQGMRIGYGGEFRCGRRTRVATVPVGFAHGLGMVPESVTGRLRTVLKGFVREQDGRRGRTDRLPYARVGDRRAPLLGRISMDQCCLDVTELPEVDAGAEVVLPVRRVTCNPAIARVYEEG